MEKDRMDKTKSFFMHDEKNTGKKKVWQTSFYLGHFVVLL